MIVTRIGVLLVAAFSAATAQQPTHVDVSFAYGAPGQQQPDPADSLYRAGREFLNRGDWGRAARTFKDVAAKFPRSIVHCGEGERPDGVVHGGRQHGAS